MSAPGRIVVAGDWHGNTRWALKVIGRAAEQLDREHPKIILSLGDFGLWPGGDGYISALSRALDRNGTVLWFIDGNHEDHDRLRELHASEPGMAPVDPDGRIWHLPRGHRWNWHGRTWLALGGGVSLDRAIRTAGRDWWPEEEITSEQALGVMQAGPAHVLVSHDVPAGVAHSFPPPPSFWDPRDLKRNDLHRQRLQAVADAVRPGWIAHGHLHRGYSRLCDFGYGPVEVTGLDCDGGKGPNWAVLDVKRMAWGETG